MTFDRRKYAREYAARQRQAKIAARLGDALATAARCPWPVSGGHPCGGPLRTDTGRLGETIVTCDWCDRKHAGVCRDCSASVEGRVGTALRCRFHKELARRAQTNAWGQRNVEHKRAMSRANYQKNDERRRARNEYKREYRKLNPEKTCAQKQRYVEKHRNDPNSAYNRYHRKYRAKYRLQKRELERDRLAINGAMKTPAPKCTRCGKSTRWKPLHKGHAGKPWTVCTPCLFPSERKIRMRNRRKAIARAKEWLESIPPATKIKRPPLMAQRGPGWERTCISPGCDIVVTHRKKKCTKCRERDRQLAEAKLAPIRGRGRRHDLKRVA